MEMVVERQEEGALMVLNGQEVNFLSHSHFLHVGKQELIVNTDEEVLLCMGKSSVMKHGIQRSSAWSRERKMLCPDSPSGPHFIHRNRGEDVRGRLSGDPQNLPV